ncbi:MAG: C40 family peptidase [Desulfobacula sp.]|nr:C40 family peptidase [Desulfobacula sp.]
MNISFEPQHKFRKLLRFAQEVEGCRYKTGGKSKKKGFDEITLLVFLFQKAFKVSLPTSYDDILRSGVVVTEKDARTGDLAIFSRNSQEFIMGLVLGQIEKEIIFSSKEKKSVVIEDFTHQIGEYKLKICLRLFDRE